MPGPPPKPAHLRARGSYATTKATLEAPTRKLKTPKLPARGKGRGKWHPRVLAWWADVWASPMAAEYLDVHRYGLEALAELRQQFHTIEKTARPTLLATLHAEIRQSQRDYGLTPMDLRRLQWEVKRAGADSKPEKKKPRGRKKGDPRKLLRVMW